MPSQSDDDLILNFTGVAVRPREDSSIDVMLGTTRGDIQGILHLCEGQDGVVLFLGGRQGLLGPAEGLYERLARELVDEGVSSLRLGQRQPIVFLECVGDALAGLSFLKGIGAQRVVLVGHSSNGAVAIKTAAFSQLVVAVAALSSQTFGAQNVAEIAPRHLLLVHGQADDVLDHSESQRIYDWAEEPKELILYAGAGHSLREAKEEVYHLLKPWLLDLIGPTPLPTTEESAVPPPH